MKFSFWHKITYESIYSSRDGLGLRELDLVKRNVKVSAHWVRMAGGEETMLYFGVGNGDEERCLLSTHALRSPLFIPSMKLSCPQGCEAGGVLCSIFLTPLS